LSQIQADIDFLLSVSRAKPKPGDETGQLISAALIRVFKEGYNGNHSRYPTEDLALHRGRIGPPGQLYEKLSDLWYPPSQFSKQGRAHLSGESLLYCAAGSATAILELRPKRGDIICMMEGRVEKSPLLTKMIMDEQLYDPLSISEESKAFERFIAKEFRRVPNGPRDYLICGALGSLFFKFTSIEAIMYTSMATDLAGVNFAFAAPIADKFLKPTKFRAYEVVAAGGLAECQVRCRAHAGAASADGTIPWEQISQCSGHRLSEAFLRKPGTCDGTRNPT